MAGCNMDVWRDNKATEKLLGIESPESDCFDVWRVDNKDQTGLLTHLVPNGLENSLLYRWFLRLVRTLQLASLTTSLDIFSSRVYKIDRLAKSIKIRRGVNAATGAVAGFLTAAVLYTLLATLMFL